MQKYAHRGVPQVEKVRVLYGDEASRSAIGVTTLLGNRSGSRRTVLPFLLSLVDGGDCAAHGLQIAESLEIRQSPC